MAAKNPSQLMPPLSAEEYAALKEDIRRNGIKVPLEKDENGNTLDGHHRQQIYQELRAEGVPLPEPPVIIRVGLSEEEKRAHVRSLNLNRRYLAREQRRQLIADQLKETPHQSNRQVAEVLGCDHKTVGTIREELEGRGGNSPRRDPHGHQGARAAGLSAVHRGQECPGRAALPGGPARCPGGRPARPTGHCQFGSKYCETPATAHPPPTTSRWRAHHGRRPDHR